MRDSSQLPDPGDLDWERARRVLAAFVRHRLRPTEMDGAEDLVQEALVRMFRMHLRSPVRNLEAAANTIADSVVRDHRRSAARRSAFLARWAQSQGSHTDPGLLGDPMDRLYFVVIAYFRKEQAPCADLAEQYFSKVEWKTLAEQQGRSYAGIRKLWSRCTARLRQAFGGDDGPLKWWFDD